MNKTSRLLIIIAALSLIATKYVPLWRIELSAPQYPEGLVMEIWTYKLGGDVDVVNGLNHYIGMGTMHTDDFVEFKILPYLIWFTTLFGIATAVVGRKGLLYAYTAWVVLFGIVAMADFYKWEYDYGHNLDPNAPIQVPGMSYQPPFIGYKQLLNFGAYSIPDIGGFLFIFNALVVVASAFFIWKKDRKSFKTGMALMLLTTMLSMQSCSTEPRPIRYGEDICAFCKMTIVDERFGGEIMSKTGRAYTFDDPRCIEAFLDNNYLDSVKVAAIYLTDYLSGKLIPAVAETPILTSETLRSPMGSNAAAFADKDALKLVQEKTGGILTTWEAIRPELHIKEAMNGL